MFVLNCDVNKGFCDLSVLYINIIADLSFRALLSVNYRGKLIIYRSPPSF